MNCLFLVPHVAGDLSNSSHFSSSIYLSVFLTFVIKLVNTSPPKLLNGLGSNFQGMFPQIPSCASNHYFSNMSYCLSVFQLSISLSYFHQKQLVNTSPPKPLNGLCSYFQGMFPQTPGCASSNYFSNISVCLSGNHFSISLSSFH